MLKTVRKLTGDQLLQEIVEVMAETDGDTILELANSIFADHPFTYIGDDKNGVAMFEQKMEE